MKKEKKKKEKQKASIGTIITLILSSLVGGAFGFGIMYYADKNELESFQVLLIFGALFISIFFHVITHEAGHLIFGLISGYRFISFRISSFTLVKKDHKFMIKKYSIAGTAGQCLMAPPPMDEKGNFPLVLYNMGGIIMNLFFTIIFGILMFVFRHEFVVLASLGAVTLMGLIMFLSNGIPMKLSGIANDGYNVFSAQKDPIGSRCFYIQLDLNAKLSDGLRMRDIPFEDLELPEDADISNVLISCVKIFQYLWYADQQRYEEARAILDEFTVAWDKIILAQRNMIAVERIFQEILVQNRDEVINELCTKQVKMCLKKAKTDVHIARTNYALEYRKDPQSQQTKRAYEHLMKVVKNNPVLGEAMTSLGMSEYMEKQLLERKEKELDEAQGL